jgi:hypothetical protein
VQALASSTQLGAIERLALVCRDDAPVTAATGRALARAHLPRLRVLSLQMDHEVCDSEKPLGIGAAGVRALVGAPWALARGAAPHDAGDRRRRRHRPGPLPGPVPLRALSIVGDPLHAAAVRALVSQSAFAGGLRKLTLGGEEIDAGPSTLDAAASSPWPATPGCPRSSNSTCS